VHLFFIHTKKKIAKILGNSTETEALAPKKPKTKARLKPSIPSVPTVLKKWLEYCDKNGIAYNKSNISYWKGKIENRVTIEQQQAVYNAINKGWKDFYMVSIKESKYHKFLGKSLRMDRDCDTLLDISYRDKKYIYQFKNIKVTTTAPPIELFNRYGYTKIETKTVPIASQIKEKIFGVIKRF